MEVVVKKGAAVMRSCLAMARDWIVVATQCWLAKVEVARSWEVVVKKWAAVMGSCFAMARGLMVAGTVC